jgi:L-amino acid N-acyltransferase YncA
MERIMNQFEIVPFEPKHLEDALRIYNYYVVNSTATFSIEPISIQEMEYLAFTGLKRFPSFVLLENDCVIGYSLLNRYKPREAYDRTAEVTIYMDHQHHGKGYGKMALKHIEDIAREFEFRALLAVICAENETSIQLFKVFDYFECAHFKQVGEKFGRVLDVVIYEKLL